MSRKHATSMRVISEQFDQVRQTALLSCRPEEIQRMDRPQLRAVQELLGLGGHWGYLEIPEKYMQAGAQRMEYQRIVNLPERLSKYGCPVDQLELGMLTLARWGLLILISPTRSTRGSLMLKPSTWRRAMCDAAYLVAKGLSRPESSPDQIFGAITLADIRGPEYSKSMMERMQNELARVRQFVERRLWADMPQLQTKALGIHEQSRRADPVSQEKSEQRFVFQPLPDEFTAEAGWRLAWASSNLGPNCIELGGKIVGIFRKHPHQGATVVKRSVVRRRIAEVEALLAQHVWRAADGSLIKELPFALNLKGKGARSQMDWPPQKWTFFIQIVNLVQVANMFIFFLSVGSRVSEAMSLRPGCLVAHPDGIAMADGMTYKLSEGLGGDEREWALPLVALEALNLQERLAVVIAELAHTLADSVNFAPSTAKSLWLQIGGGGVPWREGQNEQLSRMMEAMELTGLLGGTNLHTHRFRKTIARLVALAVVGAPKILMDLFGHKTIEMTLHYILSDPAVRAEVQEIAKAQTIMFVEKAVKDIESCGGKAAKKIIPIVQTERVRHGSDFGSPHVRALAETLTLGGTQTRLVRAGVLCMKTDVQVGPCSNGVGAPEPSRCRTGCDHRLELAAAMADADGAIAQSVKAYVEEKVADNPIMMEYWSGQVLTHLPRFETLRQRWMLDPVVQEICATPSHLVTA